jgi:L-gulonolactone oxidase
MAPETWTNWAGDQHCAPVRIARPRSEAELCEVVAQAAEQRLRVRAAGSAHSFTDIACTDGVLVQTSAMQRVIDADPGSGLVRVQGGITLHQLGPLLAPRRLALENQGDIDTQTVAGALATATHGTGVRFGNLSTRVAAMRLVTASGDVVEVDRESDPDALLAARVSLGALGIASEIVLECIPLYTLTRIDKPLPLDDTLDRLDEHVDRNDHFEFFLWPYTRTAMTRSTIRSDAPPDPTPAWKRAFQERLVENTVLSMICRTGRRFEGQVPRLNRAMARALGESRVQDHAYRVYAGIRNVRFTEMEYAIPRAHAREALGRCMDLVEDRRLPILFPFEVRFAAGDDALLSTAHERESCYIACHQFTGMEFESFFRGVEEIMSDYDGRPHWGKRHYRSAADLRELYPGWDRFQAVRARLDPGAVFTNDYTRRVLGAVAGSAVGAPS